MIKSAENSYDVIIIGAGISGLICGCYLAKAGMKVAVIEQHDKPGGYFTSFKRKGYFFDAAAHSFGNYREGGHVRKILEELGVNDLITIKRFDPSDIVITPDFSLTFWNDTQLTINELSNVFPHEKKNIMSFIKFVTSASQTEFVKLKNKTFEQLLNSFFEDKRLINAIAVPVFGNGGLPPSLMHAFNGTKIFSEFILDGGYYPEGGIQRLPDALAKIITHHKGDLLYRKLVKSILNQDCLAKGVELENGEKLYSRFVVSACDMMQTYKYLLGNNIVDKGKLSYLEGMMPSLSTLILYMGIDKPFEGLPKPGSNIWYLPHYDLNEIYSQIEKCSFDKAGAFMLRVSPDCKTVLAYIGAPFKSEFYWKENKKQLSVNFLDRIERHIPGLKAHIVYFDAATPVTLQKYTLNYQGAAFGWAKSLEQTFNISTNVAPMKGLYFTGHWTSIGFGLPGTCYSGHDTARRILKNKMKQENSSGSYIG